MVATRVRVLLVLVLLLAPSALAHGAGEPPLLPLRPVDASVGPGNGAGWALQTEEGDVSSGDLMLFTVEVFRAPVTASLWVDTTEVRAWRLAPGVHHFGRVATGPGVWALDVNASDEAHVRVSWDRPCACPSKVLTPEATGLAAAFAYTAEADGTWHAVVAEPPLQKWRVAAYRLEEGGLVYPDDLERLARSEAPGATAGGRPAHELAWPAVAGETTYLVVTSRLADLDGYMRAGPFDGREQSRASPQVDLRGDADAPAVPLVLLVVGLVGIALRRR